MATTSDLQDLLAIGSSFPFLSVYLDLGPQSRATRAYEAVLRKRFAALGRLMERGSEDEALYWQGVRQVWDYARNSLPESARGVAIFVAPRLDLFRACAVAERFETQVVLDDTPYLQPLAHVVEEHEHHLVIEARTDQAAIYMVHLRDERAVSKLAELESDVPGKTAKGGFEGWSQKRFQLHRRDHVLRHLKKVADIAAMLDSQYNAVGVVLLGQDRTISELQRILPQRLQQKLVAVGPEPSGLGDGALLRRVLPLLQLEKQRSEKNAMERLVEELGRGGLAVAGAEAVTATLLQGRVDTLFLEQGFSSPGRACTQCSALMTPEAQPGQCPYCGGQLEEVELSKELPKLAQQQGAEVEFMDAGSELERLGGVAALLRY